MHQDISHFVHLSFYVINLFSGTFWVFSIQLFVGRSTWPQGQKYIPLFPSCVCMEPADCKKGTNKVAMKLFKQGIPMRFSHCYSIKLVQSVHLGII